MKTDFVEPDLVFTKDNHLVCMHQPQLSDITDIKDHPEFADRLVTHTYSGQTHTDYWAFDFTLAELKTLRLIQRHQNRNQVMDGFFKVPTLEEVIVTMLKLNGLGQKVKPTGLYIEQKCPSCYKALGYKPVEALVSLLEKYNLLTVDECENVIPIVIQNFDADYLKTFAQISDLPRVQLYSSKPNMDNLPQVALYAHGIGPYINSLFSSLNPVQQTPAIKESKDLGLQIHVWGYRYFIFFQSFQR